MTDKEIILRSALMGLVQELDKVLSGDVPLWLRDREALWMALEEAKEALAMQEKCDGDACSYQR